MSRLVCLLSLVVGAISAAGLIGCNQSNSGVDAELLAKHRVRLTLAEEPDGAQVVPEVRNALLGISDDHEGHDHADHDDEDGDHEGHDHAEHEGDHDEADHDDDEDDEDEDTDDEHGDDEDEADHDDDEDGDDDDGDDEDEHGDEDGEEGEEGDHDEADHDDDEDGDDEDEDEDGDEDEDEDEGDLDHDEHADHEGHDHADGEHEHEQVVVTETTDSMDVVLVGQIGGLSNPWQETQPDFPFARNQAAFFLADPQAVVENEESGHQHAPGEECAFCAANAEDRSSMLAMVRFLDEKGNVLRMDVRDLFDVKETDTVVVRGTARVIAGGMMVVEATGLYVRR